MAPEIEAGNGQSDLLTDSSPKTAPSVSNNLAAEARAKRLAAILSMHGLWKDDPGKPKDSVAYQREIRSEWL